jgi:hypothetical protein
MSGLGVSPMENGTQDVMEKRMKTEIELYIKVPVEFEYEAGEKETFHSPGWPESATWIDYDEKAVMKQIEAELDKPETAQSLVDIAIQEIRDQAGEAAYEKWLEKGRA